MTTSMTKVIERTAGHYKEHEEAYGTDYVWCPGCVVVECECGERVVLNTTETRCRCGADHATLIEKEMVSRGLRDEASRPLDQECQEWREKQDEYLRSESHDRLEWGALE